MDTLKIAEEALTECLFSPIHPALTIGEGKNLVVIPVCFIEKFAEKLTAKEGSQNKKGIASR